MSFRTRLAKWLIGDRPELVREPSLEHVDHLLDLAELARLEGRSFAPIPTEETVIVLLALLKRLEGERAAAETVKLLTERAARQSPSANLIDTPYPVRIDPDLGWADDAEERHETLTIIDADTPGGKAYLKAAEVAGLTGVPLEDVLPLRGRVDSEAGARALRTIHEARELVDRQLAELRESNAPYIDNQRPGSIYSDPPALRCAACGATDHGEPRPCDVCGGGYMQREPV